MAWPRVHAATPYYNILFKFRPFLVAVGVFDQRGKEFHFVDTILDARVVASGLLTGLQGIDVIRECAIDGGEGFEEAFRMAGGQVDDGFRFVARASPAAAVNLHGGVV